MGLFILGIVFIILGVGCVHLYEHTRWATEGWHFWGWGIIVVTCILLVIVILGSVCAIANNEIYYQNMLEEKAAIEFRLDNIDKDTNLIVNGGIYNDVVEFNNKLREYKTWTHNFWIGWMYEDKPAEIDYIKLPSGVS